MQRWLSVWPRESILFLRSEDLFSDATRVLRKVEDFLGLEPTDWKGLEYAKLTRVGANRRNRGYPATPSKNLRGYFNIKCYAPVVKSLRAIDSSFWWPEYDHSFT